MPTAQVRAEFFLYRFADSAWQETVRPWLEAARGQLVRSYLLVPTRGQAYLLKQRCLVSNFPLLGVEFLTPGLARQKWRPLFAADHAKPQPAIGRELLLLGLRVLLAERIAALPPDAPEIGFWKTLQSDPEQALKDFDDLLGAGFRESDFPLPALRLLFSELRAWLISNGYGLANEETEAAALMPLRPDSRRIPGRLLVYGWSAESWPEFFNAAALVRRFQDVTVALPEPEWRGKRGLDEKWIEVWQSFLGVEPLPIAATVPSSGESVAELLQSVPATTATRELAARVVVGETRQDEMTLVADEIIRWLNADASHIGVVFPRATVAYARLGEQLEQRGVPYHTTIELPGTIDVETQLLRAILDFFQQGSRLEDLLTLWPALKQIGFTALPLEKVRDVCERLFDERQTHALSAYREILLADERAPAKEVRRVAEILGPDFPATLTLTDALGRFDAILAHLDLPAPNTWENVRELARTETRALPRDAIVATFAALIPDRFAVPQRGDRSFARVTLTTRRQAEGGVFSHLIFAESNAGVWPRRRESTPWLTDEMRQSLAERSRFSLHLFTADDRLELERQSCARLLRDTAEEIIFSAALSDEVNPEQHLGPNAWAERVLWARDVRNGRTNLENAFERLAQRSAPEHRASDVGAIEHWSKIWQRRRDAQVPFDEYFFCVDPSRIRPTQLTARQIERGVQDPAEIWFTAVLDVRPIEWKPFTREHGRALGQWAHRVLAAALQPGERTGEIGPARAPEDVRTRLRAELARTRERWPRDQFWDSFALELARACEQLLTVAEQIRTGDFVATELRLPSGATVPIGQGEKLLVRGRVDLVFFDRETWDAAEIDIIDFKTGADAKLSEQRMNEKGFGLQLGVYLAAAQSLGARGGRVWMMKPDANVPDPLEMDQLPIALSGLKRLGEHLRTGCYGALTENISVYAAEKRVWPIACVPIPHEILAEKFRQSFGPTEFDHE